MQGHWKEHHQQRQGLQIRVSDQSSVSGEFNRFKNQGSILKSLSKPRIAVQQRGKVGGFFQDRNHLQFQCFKVHDVGLIYASPDDFEWRRPVFGYFERRPCEEQRLRLGVPLAKRTAGSQNPSQVRVFCPVYLCKILAVSNFRSKSSFSSSNPAFQGCELPFSFFFTFFAAAFVAFFTFFLFFRYPHLKRPLKFKAYAESSCVVVDSEKGNIIDIRYRICNTPFETFSRQFCILLFRNKTFVRSVKHWTGQAVGEDFRYGLSAPNRLIYQFDN